MRFLFIALPMILACGSTPIASGDASADDAPSWFHPDDSGLMHDDAGCVIYNEVDGRAWTLCSSSCVDPADAPIKCPCGSATDPTSCGILATVVDGEIVYTCCEGKTGTCSGGVCQ